MQPPLPPCSLWEYLPHTQGLDNYLDVRKIPLLASAWRFQRADPDLGKTHDHHV